MPGSGSVFNADGQHEMDAAIMEGTTLKAGAVAGVQNVKNPVNARAPRHGARRRMCCISGMGPSSSRIGRRSSWRMISISSMSSGTSNGRSCVIAGRYQLDHAQGRPKKFGTVGAVALDAHGHLAAATSTGGMTNKRWQRIGDSPIIGAGTYANDRTCAVSCTGHGEAFMRAVAAYDVHALMEYKGLSLEEAVRIVVHEKLAAPGGRGWAYRRGSAPVASCSTSTAAACTAALRDADGTCGPTSSVDRAARPVHDHPAQRPFFMSGPAFRSTRASLCPGHFTTPGHNRHETQYLDHSRRDRRRLAIYAISLFNRVKRADVSCRPAMEQVENAYQVRADKSKNLLEIVKGAADFEQTTLRR